MGMAGSRMEPLQRTARCGRRPAGWTLHDIRRSVATGMGDLGVLPHIIEAALNHASGHKAGVAGIYQRSLHEKEVREALALWAKHVMKIVATRRKRERAA